MDQTEFGSPAAASLGGKARAASLSKEERQEIGRRAVEARWEKAGKLKAMPIATHGTPDHPLRIGDIEIPCYVLDDKRRVLVQGGMIEAMKMSRGTASGRQGGDRLANFVATNSISPFVQQHLRDVITDPIKFKVGGSIAYGYEATVLADLCNAVLDARQQGKLNPQQAKIATQCEVLIRSFAKVGIIALVDEATGYQYERPRRDLAEQLKKFLAESLVRYASGFPHDYLKHLCRLKGVELRPDMRLPLYFGKLTNDLVYRRIAPGFVKALKERRAERGKPYNKLYQWTSEDVGYPALMMHLGTVVTLMKLHADFEEFRQQLDEIAPPYPAVPGLFDNPADWEARG